MVDLPLSPPERSPGAAGVAEGVRDVRLAAVADHRLRSDHRFRGDPGRPLVQRQKRGVAGSAQVADPYRPEKFRRPPPAVREPANPPGRLGPDRPHRLGRPTARLSSDVGALQPEALRFHRPPPTWR